MEKLLVGSTGLSPPRVGRNRLAPSSVHDHDNFTLNTMDLVQTVRKEGSR